MSRYRSLPGLVALLALAACGGGGGGGGGGGAGGGGGGGSAPADGPPLQAAQLAILVAEGDATSEAIALAYQQARGLPAANIVRLPVATDSDVISAASFAALKATLDARLSNQIQATLVTWTRPSRVQGATCSMGLTSALAFGYSAAYCFGPAMGSDPAGTCGRTQASPYYNSASHQPFSDHGIRPSMMLGAATLAEAQAIMKRGVAADGSLAGANPPPGHAWLLRTSDVDRSVRWPDMQALANIGVPGITVHYVDNSQGAASNVVSGQTDVMFYFTGLAVVPQLASNQWRPGAVGDSLTSTAGVLSPGNPQTPVTAWLQAGATASYGTVEEPCNHTEKFPSPSVMVGRYQRGDTLIEAYWKSVQMPGQGLFVGEPLARPWAR